MKFWHDFTIISLQLTIMVESHAKAQSTRRDNITNSAFLCVSERRKKIEKILIMWTKSVVC